MRIRNRRAAARHIYIYNIITLSLCFSAQQLNDNFETILCKQKNQEKRPTLIPRCVVYRYYATYTPSQVHELLIKFVWLCCCCFSYMYIFFKSIFFTFRWWLLYETKFSTSTLCGHWIQRPVIKIVRLCSLPFAFIIVASYRYYRQDLLLLLAVCIGPFSCRSAFFIFCYDHFVCIFTL